MAFKRFSVVLILMVLLLALSIFMCLWSIGIEHLKFSVYGFAFLAVLVVILIIRLVHQNNFRIHRFLDNYIINEGNPRFHSSFKGQTFELLEQQLNRLSELYGEVKIEKEAEHYFLQNLIDVLQVGVLVYDENEKIFLKNKAVSDLLNIKALNNLEQLKNKNQQVHQILKAVQCKIPDVVRTKNSMGERILLSVSANHFLIKGKAYYLGILQDVTSEMNQEEVESWQKLIRILRHEIINSLTPITTLTSTLIDNLDEIEYEKSYKDAHLQVLEANYKGLKAIEKRSSGLMDFIKAYKELSSTLKPQLREIKVAALFEQIKGLIETELKKQNIDFKISIQPADATLLIDEKQMVQVLLNLIKNASQALAQTETAQISLKFANDIIQVIDNGPGILSEELDKIFIPFYTTKKEGSGIGLSLCKQIMYLHKGEIKVYSREGETIFRLNF